MVEVSEIHAADNAAWDAYVDASREGTIFHRVGWRDVFANALRHKTHYLIARRSGAVVGVMPCVEIRSRLFGHSLSSIPFLAYGGALGDDDEVHVALERAIADVAEDREVDFIEYRERERERLECAVKSMYVTFRKAIPATAEECLKGIPRKQRAMVRKGIGHGLESRVDKDLGVFYAILAESYRNLGTPILPRRYFDAIAAMLGDQCEILTITKDDEPVASVMSFYYRDEVIPYYGGSVSAARGLKANDFMYYELMRRAAERGVETFDFGRSREGTGSYRFKRHWGFQPEPLRYQYRMVRQREMPNVSPNNPKYQLAIRAWQKLPVAVTRLLGPPIARVLPG